MELLTLSYMIIFFIKFHFSQYYYNFTQKYFYESKVNVICVKLMKYQIL